MSETTPPVLNVETGTRLTTETTTRETPQGTVETQVVEQRQVQTAHVGFFEESEGVYSSMRLLCFMSLIAAIVFGLLTLLGYGGALGVTITLAFLGAGFTAKTVQRALEDRGPLKE